MPKMKWIDLPTEDDLCNTAMLDVPGGMLVRTLYYESWLEKGVPTNPRKIVSIAMVFVPTDRQREWLALELLK